MTTSNGVNGRIAEIERILQEMAISHQRREEEYAREKVEQAKRRAQWEEQYAREKKEWEEQYAREEAEREERLAKLRADYMVGHEDYERQIKRTNREIARVTKMFGEGVEDWVASDVDRILAILYGCDEDNVVVNMRVKRRKQGLSSGKRTLIEIDVVADCESHVLFVEAKHTLRPEDVTKFVQTLKQARPFFPEYEGYTLVGAVASLHIDESLITHAMRQGLLVFTLNNGLVKVANPPEFVPQTY